MLLKSWKVHYSYWSLTSETAYPNVVFTTDTACEKNTERVLVHHEHGNANTISLVQ